MIEKSRNVVRTAGIVYGTPRGKTLAADLYAPDAPGPHPVIVSVHGGGWNQGSRASHADWGRYLAERGYALFATDRRHFDADEPAFPGVIHDLQTAVRYVRMSAQRLGVDPDRLALMGDSSGGYIAAMAGLVGDAGVSRDRETEPCSGASCAVSAVIAVYGVFDLAAEWTFEQTARPFDRVSEKLIGVPLVDDRLRYFQASPAAYATRDRNQVAFLLSWGTEDDVVSEKLHSRPFAQLLGQPNFNVQCVILPHAQHYWACDPIDEPRSHSGFLAPRVIRFLDQVWAR